MRHVRGVDGVGEGGAEEEGEADDGVGEGGAENEGEARAWRWRCW